MADKSKKAKNAEGEVSFQATIAIAKAKANVQKAQKARNEMQAQADMLSAQIFQLYGNLLTDEARQPWENCEGSDKHVSLGRPPW